MTVIEYFISGILCIFQNQMECHFFFPREMGDVTVFVSHPNHTPPGSKMNGPGVSRGEETEGRNRSFLTLPLLPAGPRHCLPRTRARTRRPWTTPAADRGSAPSLTAVSTRRSNHKVA